MTLDEYIKSLVTPARTKTAVIEDLAKASGVSVPSISAASRGAKFRRYDKAEALSKATDRQVTVKELCE